MNKRKWMSFLSLLLLFACSQVIDLEIPQTGGQIVIFGRITNGTSFNQVAVARTAEAGALPEPLSDVLVKIIDENGVEEILQEDPREAGIYTLAGTTLTGVEGTAYQLEVQLGNRTYTTNLQVMPEVL